MIYIVTLERSSERLMPLVAQLQGYGLDYHLVYGVDGKNLTEEQCINYFPDEDFFKKKYGRSPKKNEIACALSHMEACRRFLESNDDFAIILEDDAFFISSPSSVFNKVGGVIINSDMVILGYPARTLFDMRHSAWCEPIISNGFFDLDQRYYYGVSKENKNFGLLCYAISREGAQKLLSLMPLASVIDDYELIASRAKMSLLHLRPYICIERPGVISSINEKSRGFGARPSLRKMTSRLFKGLKVRVAFFSKNVFFGRSI